MSLMPPTILADLELERHGYRVHPMGPYYQAFPDGGSITIHDDDPARTREQIARWSTKDARAWEEWNDWLAGLADVLGPMLLTVPPTIGSHAPGDLVDLARLAWRNRGVDVRTVADVTRLMTMSIADLLDDWFESPQVKGALAVNGVIGTWAGPFEPGTAYVMAHHSIGDVGDGQLGSWGFPEGGMGAVADAIRRSAESFGAEVRTDAPVASLLVSDGRVDGAVLANGEELRAPLVVTSLHPKRAFLDHVGAENLPDGLRPRHRALEVAQRRRQDQPGARPTALLHRRPERRAGRAPHRVGRDGADHGVHRAGLHRRPRGPAGRRAVLRRRHPDHAGHDAEPRRHAHLLDVHPVGARGLERRAARRRARGVRRPDDRPVRRGGAELQGLDHRPRHRRAARDGDGVRPDRRQHLPRRALAGAAVPPAARARVRRLPHPDRRPLLRQLGDPRRRRRVRHPRHAGRPGRAERRAGGPPLAATAADALGR